MKRNIKYPKIGQFREVIKNVNKMSAFVKNENGEDIYDYTLPKPIVTFKGSVKLHGTNASVSFNEVNGMWIQSRRNIITSKKDNAGFAFFIESNEEAVLSLINQVVEKEKVDTTKHSITIYGEWCGGSIQKGVALNKLSKRWVLFNVAISPIEDQDDAENWVDHTYLKNEECSIFNTNDFKTFEVDIDFGKPEIAQDKIIKMVSEVEKECPVGKAFGCVSGKDNTTGEGIVFVGEYKGTLLRFKAKGEKHSASKVKTIAPVDIEKMNSIREFIEYSVTENRFNQCIEQVFTSTSTDPDIRKMGNFIKWMGDDIITEEMDVLKKNKLEPNDVKKYIAHESKVWFMKFLDKQAGL